MRKFKSIICLCIVSTLLFSLVGCGKKESSIYDQEPVSTTPTSAISEENNSETTEQVTTQPPTSTDAPTATPTQAQIDDTIDVDDIINYCKDYIRSKGCIEQTTTVEWTSVRNSASTSSSTSTTVQTATLQSGFNQDFYFIVEESETTRNNRTTKNNGYVFCMDDNWGYISYNNKEYKILTSIVLDECEISNLDVSTLTDRFLSSLILDLEYCTLSEDENYYIIEQRLCYGDLSINNANSCSFNAFDDDTSIRQTLYFDKETFALISSDVICTTLDVNRGTENTVVVHSDYGYVQTHTYDSADLDATTEIDNFKGYSIY